MRKLLNLFILVLGLLQINLVYADEVGIIYNGRRYMFESIHLNSGESVERTSAGLKISNGTSTLTATFTSYALNSYSGNGNLSDLMESANISISYGANPEKIVCDSGFKLDGNKCTNGAILDINTRLEEDIKKVEESASGQIAAARNQRAVADLQAYQVFYNETATASGILQIKYAIINYGQNSEEAMMESLVHSIDVGSVSLNEERVDLISRGFNDSGIVSESEYRNRVLYGSGTALEKARYRDAAKRVYEKAIATPQKKLNDALSSAGNAENIAINMIETMKSNRISELRKKAREDIAKIEGANKNTPENSGMVSYTDYVSSGYNVDPSPTGSRARWNLFLAALSGDKSIDVSGGDRGAVYLLLLIAYDLKNIMYIVAGIYFLILVLKLLLASNTEEEVKHFKNGIIWISIGIIVMQIAYFYVNLLYGEASINGALANNVLINIMEPLIRVLETATSFFFVFIMIFAFYRMVTANGSEDAVKNGRMTVFYAIIGFIVVKLAKSLVYSVYGQINCQTSSSSVILAGGNSCVVDSELSGFARIIINVINWMNGFVGILTIIIIIYAGAQILFANGDKEKLKKAKNSILFVAIGIAILVLNYFILTFFINPESSII